MITTYKTNVSDKILGHKIPIEFVVGTTNSSGMGPGIADGLQRYVKIENILYIYQ